MDHSRFVELLRTVFDTREEEIVCSEFFALLPRFVDLALASAGSSQPEPARPEAALPQIAHHIGQCAECAEAYEALLEVESASR